DVGAPAGTSWRLSAELSASEGLATSAPGPVTPRKEDAAEERVDDVRNVDYEPTVSVETGGVGTARANLELRAGAPGETVYRLRLLSEDGSGLSDETTISVNVGPPPRVLIVSTEDSRAAALAAALSTQGLQVERQSPFGMPGTLERLRRFDSVVLVDVAANDLFTEYQLLLESYVREHGGGLTIIGGTSAFGPGGYYATPLEDVS